MEILDIVNKLIGPIEPLGDESQDGKRFENLKVMAQLVDDLIGQLDDVAYRNKDAHQASIKKSVEFVNGFFNDIGIKE